MGLNGIHQLAIEICDVRANHYSSKWVASLLTVVLPQNFLQRGDANYFSFLGRVGL